MAKRNPTCGCGPCSNSTNCHECCRCIPKELCVVTTFPDYEGYDYDAADCSCSNKIVYEVFAFSSEEYSGIITCGDVSIDLKFTIEKDGDDCYVFLESECLGYTGNERLKRKITPEPSGRCLQWEVAFADLEVGDCDDSDSYANCPRVVISVRPVAYIENLFGNHCGGCADCTCLVRDICVTYTNEACVGTDIATYNPNTKSWLAEIRCDEDNPHNIIEVEVFLELAEDAYGEKVCRIRVETSEVGALGDPVVLENCPDVTGSFSDPFGMVTVTVSSAKCGCPPFTLEVECCENELPATLYVTVSSNNCPCVDGVGVEINYNLNRPSNADPNSVGVWFGYQDLYGCGEGTRIEFEFTRQCGLSWRIVGCEIGGGELATIDNNKGWGDGGDTIDYVSCQPYNSIHTGAAATNATPDCCGTGDNANLEFEITE